ncbi:FkbM family methyltransferase [Rhizobium sp. AAP43]|uniref:FkbM family methyltransferase n=1 Tax=Rhizobium sp. AAP43 TaxID=1523420 RepID=UPI0006B90BBB|nr:FkbM family methyltransferase [Rhizobium sp. AAP43]KPF46380.1 hypothetical protein IP76_05695 [Rhizobium sp. AAP43]
MGIRTWLGLKKKNNIYERMQTAPEAATVTYEGIRLQVSPRTSPIDMRLYEGSDYERDVKKVIVDNLTPGAVAVDVGAHCGHHTASMLRAVGAIGTVIAIEPEPERFSLLQQSFGPFKNVHLFQAGLSSQEGVASLYSEVGVSAKIVDARADHTTQVNMTSLPVIMEQCKIAQIDLLKMDIEGHECEAIVGLAPVIRQIKAMVIEIHTEMIREQYGERKLDEMLDILAVYPKVIDLRTGRRLASLAKKVKRKDRRQVLLTF